VAPHGITVNVIAPGLIHHPHSHQESQQRLLPRVPGRPAGPSPTSSARCATCCRRPPSYVTGQVLTVDGGLQA
jgi:NAD(P)-dependent dehydrogenase (short-subunit alcohol dehydrogenase family)